MKWLASLLLIGVIARHCAANWLAETSFTVYAWFYMLGGLWEMVLCGALLWILLAVKGSIYRNLALAAMVIGVLEGLQISACRFAVTNISQVPKGSNLCDYATGLPIGATMVTLYIIIICFGIIKRN